MRHSTLLLATLFIAGSQIAHAGVINPDCTVSKAAKSTAMKATVGIGGRCDAKETVKDQTPDAVKNGVSDVKQTKSNIKEVSNNVSDTRDALKNN